MNRKIIKSYIDEYKRKFKYVHDQEIYKWKAVKQFQDNFDLKENEFHSNLELSLSKANNLLDSGQYFPKRMLLKNTEKSPNEIKEMFKSLYDEEVDILERIENFRKTFRVLNKTNFKDLNDYQDHRAIVVYLSLKFPERYFFYKYRMFKEFVGKIEYTYKPIAGRIENIGHFQNLCELVRYEISQDQELLRLHENRLHDDCYRDKNLNVLTQDFIYAVVRHLDKTNIIQETLDQDVEVIERESSDLKTKKSIVDFTPQTINYIQNDIENKRIGDLGEIWVLKYEIEFLIQNGKETFAKKVKHVSKDRGDGLGFDILSYDLQGNKKYIEVKTTKGKAKTTFFITRNELEKSKIEKEKYFLYRVFEYDEDNEQAKLMKIQGDLTSICEIPVNYKVHLEM